MARLLGPDLTRRTITQVIGSSTFEFSGRTATIYTDEAGTQLASINTYDPANPGTVGTAISGSQVTLSAASQVPQFWYPDGADVLYARVTGMAGVWPLPADVDARLDTSPIMQFMAPANPKIVTHVTSMQSGHGWTAANTSANNLNDTSIFALGGQSASVTTRNDGVAGTLRKTGLALDLSGTKQLRLLVRVDGVDNVQGFTVYASSDGLVANFGIMTVQNVTQDPSVRWLKDGEWKWVTVNWQSATITGTPNLTAIDSLQLRCLSTTGTTFTARLQAVQIVERKPAASGGIVCFTYDDSYRAQYTIAKRDLDKYGWPGTAYTIVSNVQAGDGGNTTYLTTAQLQEMRYLSGWEVAPHAMTATAHNRAMAAATNAYSGTVYGTNPLTAAELDADIRANVQWLIDNQLTDGFVGHCYPQGRYNTTVQRQMARARVGYARAMTSTANAAETMPPADPYAIRCYTLDNTSVLGTLQAQVDGCVASGGLLVYCCHDIVASPSTSTQFATATHASLVDYVAGKTGVRVMTLGDVMRSLTAQ